MRFTRFLLLVIGTVMITPLSTPTPALSSPDTPKPSDPTYTYVRTPFTCTPADSLTLPLNTTTALSDSTTGQPSAIPSYPCAPWNEAGPELIYQLNIPVDLELSARLTNTAPNSDLDLFLLNDCNSDSCLVGANTAFTTNLAAGTYYLVVDTASHPAITPGPFTLELATRELGVPLSVCEIGGALPVTCSGTTITVSTEDLFGRPNLINTYQCGVSPRPGGEIWYAVTLPGTHEVTVNASAANVNLDLNFWLFDGCGPAAQCLQYIDLNTASTVDAPTTGETITWVNDAAVPVTAYLAVDSRRAATAAGASRYNIEFVCQSNVPTVGTSFGSLKALYR